MNTLVKNRLISFIKTIKDFLFPIASCLACNHPGRELNDFYICKECMTKIKACEIKDNYCLRCLSHKAASKECKLCQNDGLKNISACYSPFYYKEPVRRLIIELKYNYTDECAKLLYNAMYSCIEGKSFDFIVPVPIHKERLKQRFKNQSIVLADGLSLLSKIPMLEALNKIKNAKTQSKINDSQKRNKNIENAFQIKENARKKIRGKSILLLDDIRTSGATARACAKELIKNGAKSVSLITCAVADNENY